MVAGTVGTPGTSTIHRLRATRGRALLVVVAVWATSTVVSGVGRVLVVPAPPVLVVRSSVRARSISSPSTGTVHRLSTSRGRALLVVVAVWATVPVVSSALGVLVGPAPPVGGAGLVATPIRTPATHAVHRLRATRCSARVVVVAVWATSTVVSGVGRVRVLPAPLVLVPRADVVAAPIGAPVAHAVHRLRAARSGA